MALIDDDTIKNVRMSNDIVDVIGSYLPLTQKGKNYFAVCPFHDDHSPSMSISKEKQIYKCFVCGATGNVISFVRDYLKVSFTEAVSILGENIGIKINTNNTSKTSKYKEYYDIYNLALSYYKNNLNTKSGEKARDYLTKRNITKEVIDYFNIGLSLNGGLTLSLSKTYDTKKLIDIGLSKEDKSDLFLNRIMFTIHDNYGNPVGFSGRIYDKTSNSKYINSKETVIFKKGTILYNYYRAKDEIRRKHEIIISEGFMEVIRLHTIGIDNAVALMGTSFTKEHLELIKNLKCEVVLNLDQDEAGKTATISIGEMLIKEKINPTVIIFSDYKDADELIVEKGSEPFLSAYKNRINFIDFKLDYLKKKRDLSSDSELATYIKDAIGVINEIDDDILREIKIKELSKNYDINEDIIRGKIEKKKIIEKKETPEKINVIKKYDKYDKSELKLLYIMLNNNEFISYYENTLGYMCDEKRRKFANAIINFKEKNKTFDYADFICYTTNDSDLSEVLKEVNMFNKTEEYTDEEIEDYIKNIKELRVQKQINNLKDKMKNTLDIEEKKKLATRIENMKKEVQNW